MKGNHSSWGEEGGGGAIYGRVKINYALMGVGDEETTKKIRK